jgi:uncharacterized protein YyaL (SSP411 family)
LGYTSGLSSQLRAAGHWLTRSGIQHPSGGVARYCRADVGVNQDISTEITGYAVSALVFAYRATDDAEYLDAATQAAHFLTRTAWDARTAAMPFEIDPSEYSYFFDCGIIARGLLVLWHVTGECELVDVAQAIGHSMARDFARGDGAHWPVLSLPDKTPLELDAARWSRVPGCYQLKSAVAWRELAAITGDAAWSELYAGALQNALASHEGYLPGHTDPHKVMDRLHPYLYFLEALLPHTEHAALVAEGVARVRDLLMELAPQFERADVAAQLLRVQCAVGVSESDCAATAARLRAFQRPDGGYYFGRKDGQWIPHVSPVPTAFAMQALEWYERRESMDRAAVI